MNSIGTTAGRWLSMTRELKRLKISGVYSSIDPASLINFLRNQNSIRVIETEDQVRVVRREAH